MNSERLFLGLDDKMWELKVMQFKVELVFNVESESWMKKRLVTQSKF